MSLVPMLFSDWWENLDHPHSIPGQTFGHGLHHDDQLIPSMPFLYPDQHIPRTLMKHYLGRDLPQRHTSYLRPWVQAHNGHKGVSMVKADKDQFHVTLDVEQFKPEEINVKVADNYIVVEAKHDEVRDDHGWVSRHFVRKYLIPQQCNVDEVKSSLSSDGVLTITVPRNEVKKHSNEKLISIEHTGKPAILAKKDTNEVSKDVQQKPEKK